MFECFHCGERKVVWQNDYDYEDLGYDGQGIVHMCTCSNCGAEIEYRVPLGTNEEIVEALTNGQCW